jgi:putative membrane protein
VLAELLSVFATASVCGSVAAVYVRGAARRRARGLRRPTDVAIAAMLCALAIVLIAVSGPVDALADELFWVHMIQHLALISIAAPLLVIGEPVLALGEMAPTAWRRAGGRLSGSMWGSTGAARRTAVTAFVVSMAVLIGWHLPIAFDAALRNDALHALEHATLLVSAAAFWWPILSPSARARLGAGHAIAGVIAASTVMAGLGAALTFSPTLWYPAYRASDLGHGIDPLADQQLAGSIMWVPAGFLYLAVVAWLFVRWMADADAPQPTDRLERCPRPPTHAGGQGRRAVG